jgi:hypothetical protein
MIVEGVLPGSQGPLYYPASEIGANPDSWNGMPIVNLHPFQAGQPVSGRDPDILNKQGVGFVFRSKAGKHDGKNKLKAEAWFDEELADKSDPRILENLRAKRPVEISTGLYTQNVPAHPNSNFGGKPYEMVATNYKPDHLAILLDQKGACSIQDGCGVLVGNQAQITINEGHPMPPVMPNTSTAGGGSPQPAGSPGPPISPDGSHPMPGGMQGTTQQGAIGGPSTPAMMRAHTATREAVRSSNNANLAGLESKYGQSKGYPEAHKAAMDAHEAAAAAHEDAASAHNSIGNREDAMQHAQQAMDHSAAADVHKKLMDNCMQQRGGTAYKMATNELTALGQRLVNKMMTTNCRCHLKLKFVRNADGSDGMDEADDSESGTDLVTMAKALGVTTDARANPAGYIKEFGTKMDAVKTALMGESEKDRMGREGGGTNKGSDAPLPKNNGSTVSAMPGDGNGNLATDTGHMVGNFRQILENAPPEYQEVWNSAVGMWEQEKKDLIQRLVANAVPQAKAQAEAIYNKMRLPELRALAETVPPVRNQQTLHNGGGSLNAGNPPSFYVGANGGPVNNGQNQHSGHPAPLPQNGQHNGNGAQPQQVNGPVNNLNSILPLPSMDFESPLRGARKGN